MGVTNEFKALREGPKVDLRKDLKVTKRVNLISQNSHGRIETYVGKEANEYDKYVNFSDEDEDEKKNRNLKY